MPRAISPLKMAAAYIGTVVGAGFASGQEVMQFFGYFGFWGIPGLVLAALLFAYFGYLIMRLGKDLNADSHLPVVRYVGGKWAGSLIDYIIVFFLFGALSIMAAGAGALFHEQLGMSKFLGTAVLMAVTLGTVFLGLSGVITAISIMVPVLLIAVIGIGVYAVATAGISSQMSEAAVNAGTPAVFAWPAAAVVYVSYNLVLAVAVLAPMGKQAAGVEDIRKGAVWGGAGLGLGALIIFLAILVNMPEAARYEIPMIYAAGRISPLVPGLYAVVLFAEIYTTAVGSLYGFTARFSRPRSRRFKLTALVVGLAALVAAQYGFTRLVSILFPLVGYAGLLMLGGMVIRRYSPLIPQPAMKKAEYKSSRSNIKRNEK